MTPDNHTAKDGFVIAADEGQAYWFLNTLTINKVGATDTAGRLSSSITGYRRASRRRRTSTRPATRRSSS